MHAIADSGFQYCTPIQALSLDHALAGRNVAGRAQTGTGKTAAFLIAILTRYLRNPAGRPTKVATPRALVLAPTRELVIQISKDADSLGKYCGLRSLAVYGGMDYDRQRREVTAGPVDLMVATPGRLLDYVQSRVIDLSQVDTLIIDEADRMLDMGFIPDIRRIVRHLPPSDRRCTMLFSATLDDAVMRLAAQWMSDPVRVEVQADQAAVSTITQQVFVVAGRDKFTLLYNLLRRHADRRVLVFCNRRDATEAVSEKLHRHGIACEMLSGDVQQNRRLRALEDFRSGKIRVVVATDVAGRGIHVDDIGFVINYDFPYEPEDYVHRIGRTGRAGHEGTAISFADENESFIIPDIEKFTGESLKCTMPEDELLVAPPALAARAPREHDSRERHAPREYRDQRPAPRHQAPRHEAPSSTPAVSAPSGHAPEWPDSAPAALPAPKAHARPPAESWVPGQEKADKS
jgi:ATP-dependent RNA helicase RhlB